MMKVGILGGTFDPPHNGHLIIAQEVLSSLQLNEVWFMPTNTPPHKADAKSRGEDRLEMVKLAIADNECFKLQPIEFERSGPSYTYDTIAILKEKYPNAEFYFIIGADMVEYLPKWYRIDELVHDVHFVGVKRPKFKIVSRYNVIEVEVPQFDMSSSELRRRFKNNQNTKYFLPDAVREYIEEKNLYGSSESISPCKRTADR
ncbi:nicotinate-nucleotide adenylyltransferase [Schinkia azotoformans]|nr:nicotinate-nucleotide adenylyltransferase [Schinkia azotoformans]MEC1640670.1 nicotinate-nucleotide adenylyltransferase [Schinkia azotoformans]MEC1715624.1 nicotinate-nucleotide adenylyltransferase [Schinkia azotoformans]MEC1720200.1 nicotinate-nucleotide adenylyltransferase [Schinkia azotoformans]MEC1742166.1 nicotinate-nucleotide adenylyltransferase [Schinkia azotoformans]MEC1744870.1 nicotinate-nucleotide adenylyltransferase [Schinkia azotoformans]